MSILIKNGTVVNAEREFKADVLIQGETIAEVGTDLKAPKDCKIVDATGRYVIPGGIDPHTHMQLPFMGTVSVDDYYTGSRAAVAGGTTMFIDFIIPPKNGSLVEAYKHWRAKADPKVCCDYGLHCGITWWGDGVIEEMKEIVETCGVQSFKMFMAYKGVFMLSDEETYNFLARAKELGALPQVHAENGDLVSITQKKVLDLGITGPEGHAMSRPEIVEQEATNRIIAISDMVGVPIYIVHVMSKGAADIVAMHRSQGRKVYGEPIAAGLGTDGFKLWDKDYTVAAAHVMSPALRPDSGTPLHLMKLLASGQLSTVATDNCTFTKAQKAMGKDNFAKIPNGVNGIEDRLSVVWDKGVAAGYLSPSQFVAVTSTNTAKLFNCYPRKGLIAAGSDADVCVWDGDSKRVISAKTHHQAVDTNIFEGMEMQGMAQVTISRGKIVYDHGKLTVEKGAGKFIPRPAWGWVYEGIKARDEHFDLRKKKVERGPYNGPKPIMVPGTTELVVLPDGKSHVK